MHKFNPANLERLIGSERAVWFPPEPVLASMSCRTGLTVLDFGAGPGYHSLRLSEQVGPTGLVIATDVEPAMLFRLRESAAQHGRANIVTLLIDERAIPLQDRAVDRVLLSLVLHELDNQQRLFKEIHRTLNADGKIVIVEWQPWQTTHGPGLDERLAPAALAGALRVAGFLPDAETALGEDCYILTARKAAA